MFSLPITNPVAAFALIALILLVVPLFARRMKVPSMVGLILAGVIIGPKGLNILDFDGGLKLLSMVGLLYIMFVAGLEIDLDKGPCGFVRILAPSVPRGDLARGPALLQKQRLAIPRPARRATGTPGQRPTGCHLVRKKRK